MTTRPYRYMHSSETVRETADRLGSHYFDRDTMRWHRSRLLDTFVQDPEHNDPEGTQVVYIMTREATTFGDDAPRGWAPLKVTVLRQQIAAVGSFDAGPVDSIVFERIECPADFPGAEDLNSWWPSKTSALNAIAQALAGEQVNA